MYGGGKKKMYKKGSFLEPNKELTFGGMKKSKYEAAGPVDRQTEDAKKAKAAAKRIKDFTDSKAAAARRGPSRQEKQNTPQGTGGGAVSNAKQRNEKAKRDNKVIAMTNVNTRSLLNTLGKGAAKNPNPSNKAISLARPEPASGTYASAKKKNPNLDKLIKQRKGLTKGTDEYNRVQNQINKAYGKGPIRKEASKIAAKPAAKNTAKPTLKVKTPAKPAAKPVAKKPAPKPAPRPKVSPSGGSGMGAMRNMDNLKNELKSASPAAKPVDRRAKRSAKKSDRLKRRVSKLQGKMQAGGLKDVGAQQKGLAKLPTPVRNKMGYKKSGGKR